MKHRVDRRLSTVSATLVVAAILFTAVTGLLPVRDALAAEAGSRTITDSFGRELRVPSQIKSVISSYPPITTIVYMLAPNALVGWNFKPDIRNMPKKYHHLPITGGWFGLWSGNYETMLDVRPDVVLYGTGSEKARKSDLAIIEERQAKFGAVPVAGILNAAHILKVDRAVSLLGEILQKQEKAEALIKEHKKALDLIRQRLADLPESRKVRVYYAEGPKGLLTDPEGSRHSVLISLCGGINIAKCEIKPGMGQTEVSMEQVLEWNPDVIITENPKFFNAIYKNPIWGRIAAVKGRKVYLTPRGPFCWFDRPPGASNIPGMYWTAKRLHPELFEDLDLNAITRDFYRDFYHYTLSDEELADLLQPKKGVSPGFLPHRTPQ